MDNKKLLGKRLKELINRKGISQEKLSELVDIEPSSLSNIIRGRNYPLFSTLEKILQVLDSNFVEVFSYEHLNSNDYLREKIERILLEHPERMKDFYKIAKALID